MELVSRLVLEAFPYGSQMNPTRICKGENSMMKKTTTSIGIFLLAVALVAGMIWSPPAQASEPFLGQIEMFGFNFPPPRMGVL
jgi:hypothetical protein